MMVPPSVFSPVVRNQHAQINHASDELFQRKSDLSGKEILANISSENSVPVYDDSEWWSDEWDALSYGIPYDSQKGFFEQLHALKVTVPRPAKSQYGGDVNVNSEWTVEGYQLHNCYFLYGGIENDNVLYSVSPVKCRDCMEIGLSTNCELGYELFGCTNCYQSSFLDDCEDCSECYFGFDLQHCESCFGSYNLRYKKYCFFNKQLTKEEYEEKMKQINFGSRKEVEKWREKFLAERDQKAVRLNLKNQSIENCLGNDLTEGKNCHNCFWASKSENSANVSYSLNVRYSQNIHGSLDVEKSVSSFGKNIYEAKYCYAVFNSSNVEYSDFCFNLENCFGCVGLKNKKFCIFNKQYSEEEYWKLVDQIKTKMLADGEYGQLPPYKYAIHPYNLTAAQKFYPLTEEEVKQKGMTWHHIEINQGHDSTPASELPDDVKDATEDIINKPFLCTETGRPFTIVKQEFEFYKKMGIALPTVHPMVRRKKAINRFRVPKLVDENCVMCNKEIKTQNTFIKPQNIKHACYDCYLKVLNEEQVVQEAVPQEV